MSQESSFLQWDVASPKEGCFAGLSGIVESVKEGFGGHGFRVQVRFENECTYAADANAFELLQSRPSLESLPEGLKDLTLRLQNSERQRRQGSQTPSGPQL